MGPKYDVRYTMVKAEKEILVAVMCFLFTEIPSLTAQLQEADNKLFMGIVSWERKALSPLQSGRGTYLQRAP